jgi:hypothetical protein
MAYRAEMIVRLGGVMGAGKILVPCIRRDGV